MGSVITGKYPNKHGMRDPYSCISGPSIGDILKRNGYKTAGFIGNDIISKKHGFAEGFDFWNEASKETSWDVAGYPGAESDEMFYGGNYWVEEFFKWLKNNYKETFFIWGHFYKPEGQNTTGLPVGIYDQITRMGFRNWLANAERT